MQQCNPVLRLVLVLLLVLFVVVLVEVFVPDEVRGKFVRGDPRRGRCRGVVVAEVFVLGWIEIARNIRMFVAFGRTLNTRRATRRWGRNPQRSFRRTADSDAAPAGHRSREVPLTGIVLER